MGGDLVISVVRRGTRTRVPQLYAGIRTSIGSERGDLTLARICQMGHCNVAWKYMRRQSKGEDRKVDRVGHNCDDNTRKRHTVRQSVQCHAYSVIDDIVDVMYRRTQGENDRNSGLR